MITADAVAERLFTATEFARMCEVGVFSPDESVELIDGRILVMPPQGPLHAAIVQRLLVLLAELGVPIRAILLERPLDLGERDTPVPDVCIARPDPFQYADGHPDPSVLSLAVEVADSSLAFDLNDKATRYAEGGVAEYWVVDARGMSLHRMRQPGPGGYAESAILGPSDAADLPWPGTSPIEIRLLFPQLGPL